MAQSPDCPRPRRFSTTWSCPTMCWTGRNQPGRAGPGPCIPLVLTPFDGGRPMSRLRVAVAHEDSREDSRLKNP